nr:hypothetical protein [Tanacetum cinerariifolium]
MTGNRALLTNFVEKFLRTVHFGNNDFAMIAGYGDVVIGSMMIKKVYYVEGLGHNLFSVGQFCDKGLEVAFRKSTCFVRNEDGVDLLIGDHTSNLYTIALNEVASNSLACLLAKASSSQSWKIHWKHHKSKTAFAVNKPLYLLHMDLCGPMHVESINGKRYVLVVVDDYSRYTWVFFFHSKDEASEVIISFIKKTQVNLQLQVQRVRTDNGCSKHMTGNRALLTNFVEKFLRTVHFGNNDFAMIAGYGDVVIGSMMIKKVYYVEGLGHNLFSVGQFCDKGLEVAFRKSTCFVRNEDGVDLLIGDHTSMIKKVYYVEGLDLLTGDHSSNLYTIALSEIALNSSSYLLAKASSLQSWLWHQRLSHLNFSTINNLVKNNLVQERRNRTLVEAVRTMLTFANLPLFLWAEAITTACFTQNHSIIHKRVDKTSYELINKRKPNIKFFWVFGCRCYLLNDYEDVGKLKAKGDIGVFIGYSKESAAFRIYNKQTRKIHESVIVNFDEISEMASKQFTLEPSLSNLNETGKSSNPSIMQSSTTNVDTSINEEVFYEVSESFQEESSSSSLNDDVQQSLEEETDTQEKDKKQSQKRQNRTQNGKDQKRQSHSKPKVKARGQQKSTPGKSKVSSGKVKVKPDKAEAKKRRKYNLKDQKCALLRKKLEEDLVTYFQDFQNTSESSDDSTNVVNAPREPFVVKQDHGVNSSQNPPHIDKCCYEYNDALDGIFCQRCTCKSCGKGDYFEVLVTIGPCVSLGLTVFDPCC